MKKILYIWAKEYPWDVRVDKICTTLHNAGYDITLLCRYKNELHEEEILNGINIIRFGKDRKNFVSAPYFFNPFWKEKITQVINSIKPDLVIVREMLIAEISSIVAKKYNIPILMDMAENYPACFREWEKYNDKLYKRILIHKLKIPDIIEKRSLKKIDGILTVCLEQNHRLNSSFKIKLSNIAIVHNTPVNSSDELQIHLSEHKIGNPINQYSSIEENIEENIEKPLILSHHGFLTAEKSLTNFIEALSIYDRNDIQLNIYGTGPSSKLYQRIIERYKSHHKIKFFGEYSYAKLNELLEHIDIGIMPYQLNDFNNYTIHNKIFDYWNIGKPVIVSAAKPLKRLIEETSAGIIIDCEKIENILTFLYNIKQYKWEELRKNTLFAKNKYNWEKDKNTLIEFTRRFLK